MSNRKKYSIFAIAGSIVIIAIAGICNRQLIMAYYYNYKNNHFHQDDKVYAHQFFVGDQITLKAPLMRLIKSTTSADYKIISSGNTIVSDSLNKYKSSYIGNYIDYKVFPGSFKGKKGMRRIYSINPNWKVINKTESAPEALPPNYVFADNNFYLNWAFVADKELNKFQ